VTTAGATDETPRWSFRGWLVGRRDRLDAVARERGPMRRRKKSKQAPTNKPIQDMTTAEIFEEIGVLLSRIKAVPGVK
jgi:hypothetical protein